MPSRSALPLQRREAAAVQQDFPASTKFDASIHPAEIKLSPIANGWAVAAFPPNLRKSKAIAGLKNENAGHPAGAFSNSVLVALLAVLLDARGAQASETMLLDRGLPGEKLFDRQRVAGAGFFERQQT